MHLIGKRPNSGWICVVIALLALANMGACSWNQETACNLPTLTGETVALRMIGANRVELVIHYEKATSVHDRISTSAEVDFGISTSTWYSVNLEEKGIIYFWIGDEYPEWVKTSTRVPIESAECRLGQKVASLIVTDGDVTLVRDDRETQIEALPSGGLGGHISIFE